MGFVVLTAGKSASYVEGIKLCCPNVERPRPTAQDIVMCRNSS